MKELYIYPIVGLYNEFYEINYQAFTNNSPIDPSYPNCLEGINERFWSALLEQEQVEDVINRLETRHSLVPYTSPKFLAVLADKDKFIRAVLDAPRKLANLGKSEIETFAMMETLAILCELYSHLVYAPLKLTLHEGFILDDISSEELAKRALNPDANPYLKFIETQYLPVLKSIQPDHIWLVGSIKLSTFTMALLAKRLYPDVHISVIGHSSEYYSLNKITKYLKTNHTLFSVIDSIVLDQFTYVKPVLSEHLENNLPLKNVPCLLYKDKESGVIKQTKTKLFEANTRDHVFIRPQSLHLIENDYIDSASVVDIRMLPFAKCYWDKCTFCGINRKYHNIPSLSPESPVEDKDIQSVIQVLKHIEKQKHPYVWSIDEAIPPSTLEVLADAIIENEINIKWQARSKVDADFSPQICEKLARSGLCEIRLGLETAIPRLWHLMDKYPAGMSLDIVERIVKQFQTVGVSVHFPMIIGFPSETNQERTTTFAYLQMLREKHPLFSFNINILGLDVASRLFKDYTSYGITTISFPYPPKYFLGNLVDWDSLEVPFRYEQLDFERNEFMRDELYSWMPVDSLVEPYIFYRLSETSRATLVRKSKLSLLSQQNSYEKLQLFNCCQLSSGMVQIVSKPADSFSEARYLLYDWNTHNHFEADISGLNLLSLFEKGTVVAVALEKFSDAYPNLAPTVEYAIQQYLPQLEILYEMGMLVKKS